MFIFLKFIFQNFSRFTLVFLLRFHQMRYLLYCRILNRFRLLRPFLLIYRRLILRFFRLLFSLHLGFQGFFRIFFPHLFRFFLLIRRLIIFFLLLRRVPFLLVLPFQGILNFRVKLLRWKFFRLNQGHWDFIK